MMSDTQSGWKSKHVYALTVVHGDHYSTEKKYTIANMQHEIQIKQKKRIVKTFEIACEIIYYNTIF